MKLYFIKSLFFFILLAQLVSCSHRQHSSNPASSSERAIASEKCMDSIKGEYHSYFDKVEKCLELEDQ